LTNSFQILSNPFPIQLLIIYSLLFILNLLNKTLLLFLILLSGFLNQNPHTQQIWRSQQNYNLLYSDELSTQFAKQFILFGQDIYFIWKSVRANQLNSEFDNLFRQREGSIKLIQFINSSSSFQ